MKFLLIQLYAYNRCKPTVQVEGVEGKLQWDECDLEGMPPQKTGMSAHDMGKTSIVPHEELQTIFKAIDGNEYLIEDIHAIWGGSK